MDRHPSLQKDNSEHSECFSEVELNRVCLYSTDCFLAVLESGGAGCVSSLSPPRDNRTHGNCYTIYCGDLATHLLSAFTPF